MEYSPTRLRMQIFPCGRVKQSELLDNIEQLSRVGVIRLYAIDGKTFLDIPNFKKHQKINRPTASRLPPFDPKYSLNTHGSLTDDSLPEGKGRERNGKEINNIGRNGSTRFPEFWSAYPKKVKKADALKKWKLKRLDDMADAILTDIKIRLADDPRWKDGFIPDPTTYINGERWNDEINSPKWRASHAMPVV